RVGDPGSRDDRGREQAGSGDVGRNIDEPPGGRAEDEVREGSGGRGRSPRLALLRPTADREDSRLLSNDGGGFPRALDHDLSQPGEPPGAHPGAGVPGAGENSADRGNEG